MNFRLPEPPLRLVPWLCLVLAALAGCSSEGDRKLPGVYRVDVQQGNVIEQEMLDKLKPGMDRNQVRFIMGTPAITDPFHADRWDYVFTMSRSGRTREQRHIIVHFQDDKLAWVEGDVKVGERKPADQVEARTGTVDVPLERNRPGVFSRMFNSLPFVGDENKPRKKDPDESGDDAEAGDAADTGQESETEAAPTEAQAPPTDPATDPAPEPAPDLPSP